MSNLTTDTPIEDISVGFTPDLLVTKPINSPSAVFKSSLLSDLPINSQNLIFGLNFRHTLAKMAGITNRLRGKKHEMDLDLSCILYDSRCNVVETIWFKQLRSANGAIRHNGDSLNGKDRGDAPKLDKTLNMEQIELKLAKIDSKIMYIALILSSYYDQPLALIERGNVVLADDENNHILSLDLQNLDKDCKALWVAALSRELNEWRFTPCLMALLSTEIAAISNQISSELARSRVATLV